MQQEKVEVGSRKVRMGSRRRWKSAAGEGGNGQQEKVRMGSRKKWKWAAGKWEKMEMGSRRS